MSPYRAALALLWSLAIAAGFAAVSAWKSAAAPALVATSWGTTNGSPAPTRTTPNLTVAFARLQERNPFRFDRRPALVRYDPWQPPTMIATAQVASRPIPVVTGILGGPPWLAVVEGLPGEEAGVVLGIGDKLSGYTVRAIRGDTVVIATEDTVFRLTPKWDRPR
jgi:hypothetical protein